MVFINKKSFLLSLLVGATIPLVVLYVLEVKENKTYEAYISEKIVNHLSVTSSSIEESVRVVQEVLTIGEMTDGQASVMETNFRRISEEVQDLAYIAQRTKKIDNPRKVYNVVVPLNYQFSRYFSNFQNDNFGKITLNEEQIALYKTIEELLLQYLEIFNIVANGTEGLTHREVYQEETAITEEYWIEILNEMGDVTEHPIIN
jgi:hypothetical protein